ncbi:hypothetical protein [Enterococcus sp. AZ128]|uniref:hypothetical protein n=1 Tax=unclassified Enterococcus TaxID=2608891 RepID=UPI003F686413
MKFMRVSSFAPTTAATEDLMICLQIQENGSKSKAVPNCPIADYCHTYYWVETIFFVSGFVSLRSYNSQSKTQG